MAYKDLQELVHVLEAENELIRVKEFVDPLLEIAEVTDRFSKQPGGGKALFFEDTGTDFPVLMNVFGSERRICLALGVQDLDQTGREIKALLDELTVPPAGFFGKVSMLPKLREWASWLPKTLKGRGRCQEVIDTKPCLQKIPVLKCWPADGGRFITLPMVITRDPVTGARNVGMYRLQVFGDALTGMHWHRHKTGARHFEEYKKRGEKMPVAVAIGGDPANTYAATAPLPDNLDEFLLAGFLRKKPVELVNCITNDLQVPADADFILEGFIDPEEDFILEGPFGDHTGFYSLEDMYPKFHVTCITHRKNALYPATIVGIPPQEDAYIAKATERIFLFPIKVSVAPEIEDMNLPVEGVAHNLALVKINKTFPGQAQKVMNALWGAGQMMFNKILMITDKKSSIENYQEFVKTNIKSFHPANDLVFTSGPLDVLDHTSDNQMFGGKVGVDFTSIYPEENRTEDIRNPDPLAYTKSKLLGIIPGLVEVNSALTDDDIPVIIVSVESDKFNFKVFVKDLDTTLFEQIKALIFVNKEVDVHDLQMVVWIVSGNIDPVRDIKMASANGKDFLLVNALRKIRHSGNFNREWPNVIVADDQTIKEIDKKWSKLNANGFIPSPSLKYKQMNKNEGPVYKEE